MIRLSERGKEGGERRDEGERGREYGEEEGDVDAMERGRMHL